MSEDIHQWDLPIVGQIAKKPTLALKAPQHDTEAIKVQAEQAGYQQGLQAGQAEIQNKIRELEALITLLSHPMQLIEENLEKTLRHVVVQISQSVIAQEITISPEKILSVINAICGEEELVQNEYTVYLHPDDLDTVKAHFKNISPEHLQVCPKLLRGEVRLSNSSIHMDGRIAERVKTVMEKVNHDL